MPKRISKTIKKVQKPRRDANQSAFATIQRTIELSEAEPVGPEIDKATISAVMAAIGRKGGKIGGKRRMVTMSAKKRSELARKAAAARWSGKD
jgi:hypothetical protein